MVQILSQQALRGPNYWSHEHPKLIQTRLEIVGEAKLHPSSQELLMEYINGEFLRLAGLERALNNPLDAVALLALTWQYAGESLRPYYEYRTTAYPGIHNLVVAYQYEKVGLHAVNLAVQCINELQQGKLPDFEAATTELQRILNQQLPLRAQADLFARAKEMEVAVFEGQDDGVFHLGYGKKGLVLDGSSDLAKVQAELVQGKIGHIPILAVTGSNGKTTTTRLLAHIIRNSGKSVGFTTSDGIYINDAMIDEGDTTGPVSAQMVLADQCVEVAVLETARGGIVRAGLGFDRCDLAVVTNVQADHLGIADIETLEQLARVKEVIVKAVKPGGWAVLNAANQYTLAMGQRAHCPTAWFSIAPSNAPIQQAISLGQPVAYVEKENMVIQTGQQKQSIAPLREVPITFNGSLGFMVENALAATLAAFLHGVSTDIIRQALATFHPSVTQTPGRMNLFELRGSKLLVDFAHNPDGFAGIRDFLSTVDAPLKIGIIVGTGDRLDEDTRALGRLSAEMFDLTLIHQVKFLRGRSADELTNLLVEGIHAHHPQAQWQRIPDEVEPLAYALQLAKPGTLIIALSDVLTDVKHLVDRYS